MLSLPVDKDGRSVKPKPTVGTGASVDLEPIRMAIKGIQFGEVRIVIQDGVVIQIDRMEKQRIR